MITLVSVEATVGNGYIMNIVVDTASELPSGDTVQFGTGTYYILAGSKATAADTAKKYIRDSQGNWTEYSENQTNVTVQVDYANVYTKSQVDTIVSGLNGSITSLQNTDTKHLAAITELINTGGKNAAQINDGSGTRNMVIPLDIPAGDYVMYIGEITSTDTDASVCRIAVADASDSAVWTGGSTRGTDKIIEFTIASAAKSVYVYASDNYTHSSGDTVTITNFMVCTKTDWDISQQYEPYCPKVDKLYAYVVSELSGINTLLGAGI